MQRPPTAYRQAVRSLHSFSPEPVWISDELLSLTLERFLRITCHQQRRHGSHVPGPLEARRRAVKRRMTALASPSGVITPPPFSLGALFGFRSNPGPTWRYEPPSVLPLQQSLDPSRTTTNSSPFFTSGSHFPTSDTTVSTLLQPPAFESPFFEETSSSVQTEGQEGVKSAETDEAATVDLDACLIKFKSLVNLPISEVGNQWRSLQDAFERSCPASDQAGVFCLRVLEYLMQDNWKPKAIFDLLLRPTLCFPEFPSPESIEFAHRVRALSTGLPTSKMKLRKLYKKLFSRISDDYITQVVANNANLVALYPTVLEKVVLSLDARVDTFRDDVRRLAKNFAIPDLEKCIAFILANPNQGLNHIAALVTSYRGKRDRDLAIIGRILHYIPRSSLCGYIRAMPGELLKEEFGSTRTLKQTSRYIMTWLKILHHLDSLATMSEEGQTFSFLAYASLAARGIRPVEIGGRLTKLQPTDLVKALLHWMPYHESIPKSQTARLVDFIETYPVFMVSVAYPSGLRLNELLAEVFIKLQSLSIPNHGFAELALEFVHEHKTPGSVLATLEQLAVKGGKLSDTTFLYRYMFRELEQFSKHQDPFVFHLIRSICALDLGVDKPFPVKKVLNRLQALQARHQFQHILGRARDAHLLPLVYNSMAESLMDGSTKLVHQLAHQYSIDHTRTYLQASRSMYYLYRYIVQRELPMGPLFTKALVRVFLIRPLMENRFVTSRRCIWVCGMVAQVEGEHVARKIREIFSSWRGGLIGHAQKRLHRFGGSGEARVATMKSLGLLED
ncbi:uncharacterized protein BDR25DRAFT_305977 [Lindgomyces ingoldianus]|uniref:Uncharacterized protein n=1 Tax=Lindgomyces ingoldianus TaxID=673940 RepID=A0ACB6QIB3_9PLEO|nr:uncharacterized protein BDR25DRAFT_305977 [Lindgomyces ingoldianus]KAF2466769.1 hypothetical protein BDR25DRAFT_305977 [Lindgomyces ingoldianus]